MSADKILYTGPLAKLHVEVNSLARNTESENTSYDVIVLGVGSMGSATCYYLAQEGVRVLGLERFDISHENGSHAGQSRIIRQAYFEHPDYVPLLKSAYKNWQDLEHQTGARLYHQTGLLYFAQADHPLITETLNSAKKYQVNVDILSSEQVLAEYPQFNLPPTFEKLYEPNAGFVTPERAILLYAALAMNNTAEIHTHEQVINWSANGDSIEVSTTKGTYSCSKLIITVGAWAGHLMPELEKKLIVTRQMIAWMNTKNDALFELGRLPCWTLADEAHPGMFYGFPILPVNRFGGPIGLKLGHHYPGIESQPDHLERLASTEDQQILINMLAKFIPEAYESISEFKVCMYTNTPDANFIVDFLPDYTNIVQASGFSGHGFKFASIIGEILTDLVIQGKSPHPIEFLSANRFF